jgi:hypothetical protein
MIADVLSPCTGVCRIDDATDQCSGCFRTLEEITVWSRLSAPDKLQIIGKVRSRIGTAPTHRDR